MAMSPGFHILFAPLMGRALTTAPWALWGRRCQLARVAAAGQVPPILWGRALARFYLIPPDPTIRTAAAPRIPLILVLWALLAEGLVLFPSVVYLLRVFKREPGRP
jgi:hypothetical protein